MITGAIPLLYSPDHHLHAPQNEFEQGTIIQYKERPERIESIYRHLITRGMGRPVPKAGAATIESLVQIHSLQMLDYLEAVSHSITQDDAYLYADIFPIRASMMTRPKDLEGRMGFYCTDILAPVGKGTWQAATTAAGLALQGAELIMRREASCAYVLVRPPGHHAGPDFFGSYCYLNNAALAASHLLGMGRVAVLDIDYHHGNGTQAVFWEEPRVLYASLHIDPNLGWPFFSGYRQETGGIQAPGSTFNIPLPPNTTAAGYLQALFALLGAIRAFMPSALVVSLGLDAYQGDPMSDFRVEAGAYTAIGANIAALKLPTLLVQEGGYSGEKLPVLAENFLTGFLGNQLGSTPPGV
jgi:acetoin utilization deacetylase AcuC-like enzyme